MAPDAGERMDRIYRHQRHFYDLTRKFYLLGRDRLIAGLALPPRAQICEIGCGTGRNLVALARRHPDALIFGIDASEQMLKTARAKLRRSTHASRIRLGRALAESFDPEATFGVALRFDAVLFSYTLSMIPEWERALERAAELVKPGGLIAVVDFSQQRRLPAWFRRLLRRWLALFEVEPRAALGAYLRRLAARQGAALSEEPLFRDYACLIRYRAASG